MSSTVFARFLALSLITVVKFHTAAAMPDPVYAKVTSAVQNGNTLTINSGEVRIRIVWYAPDVVRVDIIPAAASVSDSSFAVVQGPSRSVAVTFTENDSSYRFATTTAAVIIQKESMRLFFVDAAGRTVLADHRSGGFIADSAGKTLRFEIGARSHFYGTGERGTSLDKRGQRFLSYNTQIGGYRTPLETMNLNVPFVAMTDGAGLFIDNTYRGTFDCGKSDSTMFTYSADGGELTFYTLFGRTVREQVERYTWLTGRQPLPPRWALGFIQSKNRYTSAAEVRNIVSTMRSKRIPCDAVVLDLAWFRNMGDIAWDTSAFPAHETMVTDFLSQGMKTILITEPYLVSVSKNYPAAVKNGFLARNPDGSPHLMPQWWSCGCDAALLDLTNPDAAKWWWSVHPAAFGAHVAGIWTDLGEPERHADSVMHDLGPAVKVHNIYNLLWAKTIFDGFTTLRPNERVMNLTRSGFAGIQRYGVLPWSGDVSRSFGGLAVQLPMLLNMGMSGIGYHNSDMGGYFRNPTTAELYIRWTQFSVFSPITRAHGAGENVKGSPTEPWGFGPEAERICRSYLELRYALLPYNYSLAYENYRTGIPLARPLFWLEEHTDRYMNESSSYMWGDAFLVSPVVTAGETTKSVTLPQGDWYDYWTDERSFGGKDIVVPAPLDRLPLFVKAGSIVPMAPPMQFSDERPLDTIIVQIYPDVNGESNSSYDLYEDDGRTTDYQKGASSLTMLKAGTKRANGSVSLDVAISASRGTFNGKREHRVYLITIHGIAQRPGSVMGRPSKGNGVEQEYRYDTGRRTLTFAMKGRTDSAMNATVSGVRFVERK